MKESGMDLEFNYVDFEKKEKRFKYAEGAYRDKIWFFLFYVHLFGMAGLGFIYGPKFMKALNDTTNQDVWDVKKISECIPSIFISVAVGVLFGGFWLQMLKRCKLTTLLILYFGLMVLMTVAFALISIQMLFICILILALMAYYFWAIKYRIPFAQAIMRCSTDAVQDNYGSFLVGFLLVALQIVWVLLWSFITLSIFYAGHSPNENIKISHAQQLVYFLLLISLYWTTEVIKNIGHVTIAGTVASWWFIPKGENQTRSALRRALTTSFGSIVLGSLIVAVIKAVRAIVNMAKNRARMSRNVAAMCLLACTECLLHCIERIMEYFNMYAYTHIAVYGEDYITAAKSTYKMFQAVGFSAIINDDITGMAIGLGVFLGGVAGCVAGILYGLALDSPEIVVLGLFGFMAGAVMTSLITNVIASAIATTFVCWAEDSAAMKAGRCEHFEKIRRSRLEMGMSGN